MNDIVTPRLRFMGAVGTVTGSRYLVESARGRILIDCGLFQGFKNLRERNWKPFPVEASSIGTILLTHAHLDHSGYLPALVRDGFAGRILATPATAELCGLLLRDSAHLQEEDARFAKAKGFSRHREPRPLYTATDAERALERFDAVGFDQKIDLGSSTQAEFIPSGHLLGAAQIRLTVDGVNVHFSGDLGRDADPLMRPPRPLTPTDYLVCESTYGNRQHPAVDPEAELEAVLNRVLGRGGVVLVPAFAVGRAQGLMYYIARLQKRGRIPNVPLYLNSPMAADATDIYHRYHEEHHVTAEDCQRMASIARKVESVSESKRLNMQSGPMIIISASGMLTGGRILHHVASFGGDRRNAILLSGFQAGGTRGAALAAGIRQLRMFGRDFQIEAEVVHLGSMSGHADADEIVRWMVSAGRAPQMTFLTHGEPDAADSLRRKVKHELGWPVRVPEHLEAIELDRAS